MTALADFIGHRVMNIGTNQIEKLGYTCSEDNESGIGSLSVSTLIRMGINGTVNAIFGLKNILSKLYVFCLKGVRAESCLLSFGVRVERPVIHVPNGKGLRRDVLNNLFRNTLLAVWIKKLTHLLKVRMIDGAVNKKFAMLAFTSKGFSLVKNKIKHISFPLHIGDLLNGVGHAKAIFATPTSFHLNQAGIAKKGSPNDFLLLKSKVNTSCESAKPTSCFSRLDGIIEIIVGLSLARLTAKDLRSTTLSRCKALATMFTDIHESIVSVFKGKVKEYPQRLHALPLIKGDDIVRSLWRHKANIRQILQKAFTISGTNEAINKAGRGSEIAYQTAKRAKELARDIEYALVINATSSAGCSNNTRMMKGLDGWISTNCTYGGASVGASVTLSVGNLNDALQTIWAAGGFPRYVLCGAFQKRKISDFSTNTRNVTADAKKLVQAVDVFLSDFGEVIVKLHHQINTTIPSKVLILGDMEHWNKAWLRPVKRTELAKTGDATKFQMIAELTLESRQEAGHGKIAGLKTA